MRVGARYRGDYRPGNKGTMSWVPPSSATGGPVYAVAKERGGAGREGYLRAGDIEPGG